ncbi:MAG: hypothetical protein A2V93_06670 [Ignavibacteria bacterium RBG_16_34_14]|nr:MAG: hypothetical protein A2V93_06670 [Ignavibacteria bacterium RBG_16_34_14]
MKRLFDQKKIINILFIAAAAILVVNLLVDKFFLDKNNEGNSELSSAEIDSTFHLGLYNLGIHKDWIKKQKGSEIPVNISVRIPNDLPIVLVLREMNSVFDTNEVKINSVEKKIGGSTTLNFISGEKIKLKASLVYNDKVRRKSARVGFIVNRTDVDNENDSPLLGYPEQFAFMLIPSKNSAEFIKKILKNGKEYIIYLNDNIDELKFKLSDDYSPLRLKNSIREIVGAFPQAVFFLIDNKSSLFNSNVYPLLKKELEKRKIKLLEESRFKSLSYAEKKDLFEIFNNALDNINSGEDKVYIISAEDFLSLNPEIIKYRKLGYRFTNPSALLF